MPSARRQWPCGWWRTSAWLLSAGPSRWRRRSSSALALVVPLAGSPRTTLDHVLDQPVQWGSAVPTNHVNPWHVLVLPQATKTVARHDVIHAGPGSDVGLLEVAPAAALGLGFSSRRSSSLATCWRRRARAPAPSNAFNLSPLRVDSQLMSAPPSSQSRERLWDKRATAVAARCRHRHVRSDARSWLRDESGFGLLEVVIAGALLMLVLIPAAGVLYTSETALATNRSKVVAANVANGVLETDRAIADQETWSGSAPSLPVPASQVTASRVSYTVDQSAGWCAESAGKAATWGSYSPTSTMAGQPAYAVQVTVYWGDKQAPSTEAFGELLTTPPGVTPPASSTSCPL